MADYVHKNYVKSVLITMIMVLLISSFINYYVDPAHIFSKAGFEQGIADLLIKGENVAKLSNYNERLVQKYYVQHLDHSINTIVLGSSRSMQIRSYLFPKGSFFNHSVSGASLEDHLAIYQLYLLHGFKPNTVVLGLDPWLLNSSNVQTRWQDLAKEYYSALNDNSHKDYSVTTFYLKKYKELVSISYLISSIKTGLKILWNNDDMYYPTSEVASSVPIKLSDGSLVYEEKFRNQDKVKVEESAKSYALSTPIYSLGNYSKLDDKYKDMFEGLIDKVQGQNVQVIFFLPPYHPLVYEVLASNPDYKMVTEAEKYFRVIARRKGIKVYGSYNPRVNGCSERDFFDGMHPKERAIMKIFNLN